MKNLFLYRHYQLLALALVLMVGLSACSILTPQLPPTIPPPPVTLISEEESAAQVGAQAAAAANLVTPSRDPDIVSLMNAVSEQQLIAYVQALEGFGTRNSFSDTTSADFGIGATRSWIRDEFTRVGNGKLSVQFEPFPLSFEGAEQEQQNVVAVLPGISSHPGAIVIGAHYDSRLGDATDGLSISPSANDNAAGVAMVIELARLMSSRTWNQTIIFVAFAAEEQNTTGSRYFVSDSLIKYNRQIDLAISSDTIGGRPGIPQSLRLFAPNLTRSPSGEQARYMDYLSRLYLPEFPLTIINALDREGRYGDQREFINQGISAVRFTESIENEALLNSTSDTWDKIDYGYLAQVTRLNLITVANWAGAPKPTSKPNISPLAEAGTYQLTWAKDLQAASYALSLRPVDQSALPELRIISNQDAGSITISGIDPGVRYGVSLAPIGISGKVGGFSAESCLWGTVISTERCE